jgi:ApbE superfamily uncharacterized protein (UPF0280 family)
MGSVKINSRGSNTYKTRGSMKRSSDYRARYYRRWQNPPDLVSFSVRQGETDLQIYAQSDLSSRVAELTARYRRQIEETIQQHPQFETSLVPLNLESPYRIIREMIEKSKLAGVGPMAGVAGAVAEYVGSGLLPCSDDLIVENGGDLYIKSQSDRTMLVYAGEDSPFRDRLILKLKARQEPYGVCTSSAAIGHSLSFGKTDATVIVAPSVISADVFATAIGNLVKNEDDIENGLELVKDCGICFGALIVIGERVGAWGEIEFA